MRGKDKGLLALLMSVLLMAEVLCTPCLDVSAQEATEKDLQEVSANQQVATELTSEGKERYVFYPKESGEYTITSQGEKDSCVSVYDEDGNEIACDNDSGKDFNFSANVEMVEQKAYYVEVGLFQMDDEGVVSWNIQNRISPCEPENVVKAERNLAAAGTSDFKTKGLPNGTLAITDYVGDAKALTIPETIGGKKVTVIGEKAFEDTGGYEFVNGKYVYKTKTNIQTVTIPKSVVEIQYAAFSNCSSLKTVMFAKGSKLKKIGENAFLYNKSLSKMVLPTTVQEIGTNCFNGCEKIKDLNLKNLKKLRKVGASAFCWTGLKSLYIPDSVTSLGGSAYAYCNFAKSAYIGKRVTELPDYLFSGSTITSIKIPKNVKTIGNSAFAYTNLTSVVIPNSVTTMGTSVFQGCNKLKRATVSNKLLEIPDGTFAETGLQSIKMGGKTKKIGDFAFEKNTKLKSVKIPNCVTEIQYAAFRDCTSLSRITFPKSLERLGGRSFENTKWYKNQSRGMVYAGNVFYTYKGSLPKNKTITIKPGTKGIAGFALNGSAVKSVIIPEGVTNVGEAAFFNCKNMRSIYIPKSVTQIGDCAIGMVPYGEGVGNMISTRAMYMGVYPQAMKGFTILGVKGSAAEKYAKKYGIPFKQTYKVVFKVGNKVLSTQYVEKGKSATAPASTRKGYSISWNKKFNRVKSNMTIQGKWSNVLNIMLDNGNATRAGTTKIYEKYKKGFYSTSRCKKKISKITVPKKDGYIFEGYYTKNNGKGTKCINSKGKICIKPNVLSKDTTLYAKWRATKYNVVLHANDGTQTTRTLSCTYDQKTKLVLMERQGYRLVGWTTGADGTGASYAADAEIINLTKDGKTVHLYAQWRLKNDLRMAELAASQAVGTTYINYVYITEVGGLYNKYNNNSGSPWCAYFVSWCADQLGIDKSILPRDASVPNLYTKLVNNCGATVVATPQAGDLVFYKYGKGFIHVGLMINETQSVQGNVWVNDRSYLVKMDNVDSYRGPNQSICEKIYVRPKY